MDSSSYLYRPIYFPVIVLSFLLILSWYAYDQIEILKKDSHNKLATELMEAETLSNQVEQIKRKVDLVDTYYGRFYNLYQSELFLNNDRVDWLDQLLSILVKYDVKKSSVNFFPRKSVLSEDVVSLSREFKLFQYEKMILEGELQHEADLLHIISDIKINVNPLILLESCEMVNKVSPMESWRVNYDFHEDKGNIVIKCTFNLMYLNLTSKDRGNN